MAHAGQEDACFLMVDLLERLDQGHLGRAQFVGFLGFDQETLEGSNHVLGQFGEMGLANKRRSLGDDEIRPIRKESAQLPQQIRRRRRIAELFQAIQFRLRRAGFGHG